MSGSDDAGLSVRDARRHGRPSECARRSDRQPKQGVRADSDFNRVGAYPTHRISLSADDICGRKARRELALKNNPNYLVYLTTVIWQHERCKTMFSNISAKRVLRIISRAISGLFTVVADPINLQRVGVFELVLYIGGYLLSCAFWHAWRDVLVAATAQCACNMADVARIVVRQAMLPLLAFFGSGRPR